MIKFIFKITKGEGQRGMAVYFPGEWGVMCPFSPAVKMHAHYIGMNITDQQWDCIIRFVLRMISRLF